MTDKEREARERDLPRGDRSEDAEPMLPRNEGEDVVAWVERNLQRDGWAPPPKQPKTYQEQLEERLARLRQQPPERDPGQEG